MVLPEKEYWSALWMRELNFFHHGFSEMQDGSSRILYLWDQSIPGNPPKGYTKGTEYTKEEIDKALALGETEGRRLVPSMRCTVDMERQCSELRREMGRAIGGCESGCGL